MEAAVQLFAQQGFSGTSTREIARLADVNETSLFRHFSRKQELFWAALHSRLDRVRMPKELQTALAEDGNPAVVVPLILKFLVQTATLQRELIRILQFSLLELRPSAERICRQQLAPILQPISDYLSRCIESGTLRKLDSSLPAVAVIGTILAHEALSHLSDGSGSPYCNADEAVAAYSKFWLDMLMPCCEFHGSQGKVLSGGGRALCGPQE